jgi:hypothetical protein
MREKILFYPKNHNRAQMFAAGLKFTCLSKGQTVLKIWELSNLSY